MVRFFRFRRGSVDSFPLARGDGPEARKAAELEENVIPSRVGMVREKTCKKCHRMCYPRARGDGPYLCVPPLGVLTFSPRPWGWSEYRWM